LIERSNIGGTCVNTGCTPTTTMVARRGSGLPRSSRKRLRRPHR
jgi:pyruvate/2-oxoglutarate dehydrogenase complex dihydrolipoamide dehydrogenase (E3) component